MHDVLREWADFYRAAGATPGTIRLRIATLRSLLVHAKVEDPLRVTPRQIVAWLATQRTTRTRATYHCGVTQFYGWCVRYDLITDNPMLLVPHVKQPQTIPRPVAVPLILTAITEARSWQARAYLTLAFYAGLRGHEVAKIHSDDVDLDHGVLFVRGKGAVEAQLPMHPLVATLARSLDGVGYWFPSSRTPSGHVVARSVSLTIKTALIAAGAPPLTTAHQVRHAFITSLFDVTSNARVVQELARHASLQTTQGYARVEHEAMRKAIGRLAA